MPPDSDNGWNEHKLLIEAHMKQTNARLTSMERSIGHIRTAFEKSHGDLRADIATLNVKSGVWGGLGCGAMLLLAYVVKLLERG